MLFSVHYKFLFSFTVQNTAKILWGKCQGKHSFKSAPVPFYLFLCFLTAVAIHQRTELLLPTQVAHLSLHEVGLTL